MMQKNSSEAASTQQPLGNMFDTEYLGFVAIVNDRFKGEIENGPIFKAAIDGDRLWQIYIDAQPPAKRQYSNCSACRHFIKRYGGLVSVNSIGQVGSVLWRPVDADPGSRALAWTLENAEISGVFLTSDAELGSWQTGAWKHLWLAVPSSARYRGLVLNASQAAAQKTQDFNTVMTALREFSTAQLDKAVTILESDALYRSEKVLGAAKWLRDLKVRSISPFRDAVTSFVWKAVATAPAGFCHPRSSMIGTLLEDIAAGLSLEQISSRFAAKMHPLQYQRPSVAPAAGNVKAAEDLVEKLGIKQSLQRRYARLEDVFPLWLAPKNNGSRTGVFADVRVKIDRPATVMTGSLPKRKVTWERFQRELLPHASSVEVLVPARGNFTALVTSEDPNSPPILQWDRENDRNPVSWFLYNNGSTASRWNLTAGTWSACSAVTLKPSMWGSAPAPHQGEGAVFIIDGCKEAAPLTSLALFPEIMRSELHGVRSTIEAYSRTRSLSGLSEASACGIMIERGSPAVEVRVVIKGVTQHLEIDRWD